MWKLSEGELMRKKRNRRRVPLFLRAYQESRHRMSEGIRDGMGWMVPARLQEPHRTIITIITPSQ